MLKNLSKYHIILGSKSPRRQQLLKDLGVHFSTQTQEVDEVYPKHLKNQEIPEYLCKLKATAFDLKDDELLITSDTLVFFNNQALGKPQNREEAFEMIQQLSGNTHQVISSVCLKTNTSTTVFSDITEITFETLTEEQINFYITQFQPFDKAGSYGVQEWIGYVAASKIEGSYTNVVGLPTQKLFKHLSQLA